MIKNLIIAPAIIMFLISCGPEQGSTEWYLKNIEQAEEDANGCLFGRVTEEQCKNASEALKIDDQNNMPY